MAEETIRLTHAAPVPGSHIVGITHAEGGVIPIELGIIACEFVTKFLCLLVVIKVSFPVIFAKTSTGMATPTIPDHEEGRFVHFGELLIDFLSQLA
jgi:hypothetical protein